MRRLQGWHVLIPVFLIFWIVFAVILILSGIPFFVVSIALTTILALSLLVVALAWAYTHNY